MRQRMIIQWPGAGFQHYWLVDYRKGFGFTPVQPIAKRPSLVADGRCESCPCWGIAA